MFVIYGKRKARIRMYTDNRQYCKSCNAYDLNVKVYKDYFHLFFIPFLPTGDKSVKIVCNNCGEPFFVDYVQKEYEKIAKTPFYLYAGIILIAVFISLLVNANIRKQNKKEKFVENPHVGDVYLIRKDENNSTSYYFLRLSQISGDTLYAFHNNLEYIIYPSKLHAEDFFMKDDELVFSKKEINEMLNNNEINSVERNYGSDEGFNRIK